MESLTTILIPVAGILPQTGRDAERPFTWSHQRNVKTRCHQDSDGTAVQSAGFGGSTLDSKVQKEPLKCLEDTGTL